MTANEVERRVTAEKKVARFGKKYLAVLNPLLKEFENKKIFRVDGSRTKEFSNRLAILAENFNLTNGERVWVERSYKSLQVRFNFWVEFGVRGDGLSDGAYYELYAYLGRLGDSQLILEEVYPEDKSGAQLDRALEVRYAHVRSVRNKVEVLEKKIRDLHSTIPFYAKN